MASEKAGLAPDPDGTGLFAINVTVVGGASNVPYHFNFVITEARIERDELIATRMVFVQQDRALSLTVPFSRRSRGQDGQNSA